MEIICEITVKYDIKGRNASKIYYALNNKNFGDKIFIEFNERQVRGSSLLGLMSLGIRQHDKIKILSNGLNPDLDKDILTKIFLM